ncbi:leucine-rich repeat protein [Pelomyxa schiedti]|nr:leucine-rich repeat protein [Pelomyxa schiedti]
MCSAHAETPSSSKTNTSPSKPKAGHTPIIRVLPSLNDFLSSSATLACLDLSGEHIGDEGARLLAAVLSTNKSIKTLDLSDNEIGPDGAKLLSEAIALNSTLTYLCFARNHIGPAGAKFLSETLQCPRQVSNLATFSGVGPPAQPQDEPSLSLLLLNLDDNNLGPEGTRHIAEALKVNRSLDTLSLASNRIGAQGTRFIFDGLAANKYLSRLNLSDNGIGPDGALFICAGVQLNKSLIVLHIQGTQLRYPNLTKEENELGPDGVRDFAQSFRSKTLTELNLSSNKIGPYGAKFVCQLIRTNNSLRSLELKNNMFGPEGSSFLTEGISSTKSLTHLDLQENAIGPKGMQLLSSPLALNTSIVHLNLNGNSVGMEGVSCLCTALQTNYTLTQLNLTGNGVTPEGALLLSETVKVNRSLTDIELSEISMPLVFERNRAIQHQALSQLNCTDKSKCSKTWFAHIIFQCISHQSLESLVALLNAQMSHSAHWILNPSEIIGDHRCTAVINSPSQVLALLSQDKCSNVYVDLLFAKQAVCVCQMQPNQALDLFSIVSRKFPDTDPKALGTLIECTFRTWARSDNWSTLLNSGITFASGMNYLAHVNLSSLELTVIPEEVCDALVEARCTTLDLSWNYLDSLPSTLQGIPNVILTGNPLRYLPTRFTASESGVAWTTDLRLFLKCNGNPVPWNVHKLLFVGESAAGKTTLLYCLENRKKKTDLRPLATDGIAVHKVIKLDKKNKLLWNAWDLGGQETLYPSHQFFLTSESTFLILFDLSLLAAECSTSLQPRTLVKVRYWLNQVIASQRFSSGKKKHPHVVIIGTHLDVLSNDDTVIERALTSVTDLTKEISRCRISAVFALSSKTGDGLFLNNPQANNIVNALSDALPELVAHLEECARSQQLFVPKGWVEFHKVLTSRNQEVIMWADFLALAVKTITSEESARSKIKPRIPSDSEVKLCANFLADSGTIIHFRSIASGSIGVGEWQKQCKLEDIVILKIEWLSDVMSSVITISSRSKWISQGFLPQKHIPFVFEAFHKKMHSALIELLNTFEISFPMPGEVGTLLIPCLLPDQCPLILDMNAKNSFSLGWCPFTSHKLVSKPEFLHLGRAFRFKFTPIGMFSRLLIRVLGIPRVSPLTIWKNGVILSIESTIQVLLLWNEETQTLCIQLYTKFFKETHIAELSCALKDSASKLFATLALTVTTFLRAYYPSLIDDITEDFPCPLCFTSLHLQCCRICGQVLTRVTRENSHFPAPEIQPEIPISKTLHVFTKRECMSVLTGKPFLLCPNQHLIQVQGLLPAEGIPLSLVAPDLALEHLPIIKEISIGSFIGEGGFGKVFAAEYSGNMVAVKQSLTVERDLADIIMEATIMSAVSPHCNVVKFFGMLISPLSVVMELVPPCSFSLPQISLVLERPDLAHLLMKMSRLIENDLDTFTVHRSASGKSKRESKDVMLASLLPMALRKKIILDVASGLNHLHRQTPPLIHNDLHSGNVFICSLDVNGVGPWAKISDFGLSEFLFAGTTTQCRANIRVFSPEVLSGVKCNEKADIWSLGMIVDHILNPFGDPFEYLLNDQFRLSEFVVMKGGNRQLNENAVRNALIQGTISPLPPLHLFPILESPHSQTENSSLLWVVELLQSCWQHDPDLRPSVTQLISRIQRECTILPKACCRFQVPKGTDSASQAHTAHPTKLLWVEDLLWSGHSDGMIVTLQTHLQRNLDCPASSELYGFCVISAWKGHSGRNPCITCLFCLPRIPEIVVSTSADGEIKLWKRNERNSISDLLHTAYNNDENGRGTGLTCLSHVPTVSDAYQLWGGDVQGNVSVWQFSLSDLSLTAKFCVEHAYTSCDFAPSGRVVSMASVSLPDKPQLMLICCQRGGVAVFDCSLQKAIRLLLHPAVDLTKEAFSCVVSEFATTQGFTPVVWVGTTSGKLAHFRVQSSDSEPSDFLPQTCFCNGPHVRCVSSISLAVLHHGDPTLAKCFVISGSEDGSVIMWDGIGGLKLCSVAVEGGQGVSFVATKTGACDGTGNNQCCENHVAVCTPHRIDLYPVLYQ